MACIKVPMVCKYLGRPYRITILVSEVLWCQQNYFFHTYTDTTDQDSVYLAGAAKAMKHWVCKRYVGKKILIISKEFYILR